MNDPGKTLEGLMAEQSVVQPNTAAPVPHMVFSKAEWEKLQELIVQLKNQRNAAVQERRGILQLLMQARELLDDITSIWYVRIFVPKILLLRAKAFLHGQ